MKLAMDRSLNYVIYPVVPAKGRRVNFPLNIKTCRNTNYIINGYWDAKCMMLMDLISTKILKIIYGFKIPSHNEFLSNYSDVLLNLEQVKKAIKTKITEDLVPKTIMTDDDIRLSSDLFINMTSNEINEIIGKASACRFTLNYPIKIIDREAKCFNYFDLKIDNDYLLNSKSEILQTSKDGRILKIKYTLSFDNNFGFFYSYNIKVSNITWVKEEFYRMSDYAQLLYRLLIMNRKPGVIELPINEIITRLNFQNKNIPHMKPKIEEILIELKNNNYIKKWELYNPTGKRKFAQLRYKILSWNRKIV